MVVGMVFIVRRVFIDGEFINVAVVVLGGMFMKVAVAFIVVAAVVDGMFMVVGVVVNVG